MRMSTLLSLKDVQIEGLCYFLVQISEKDVKFLQTLGQGASGVVQKAFWPSKAEFVAVKKISILDNIPITEDFPVGEYSFLAVTANTGQLVPNSDLVNLDFNISGQDPNAKLKLYFKEKTVAWNTLHDCWIYHLLVENTGNVDIMLLYWTTTFYDSVGNKIATYDYSEGIYSFKLENNTIAPGEIGESMLGVNEDIESGWVSNRIEGEDPQGKRVVAETDKLKLLPQIKP